MIMAKRNIVLVIMLVFGTGLYWLVRYRQILDIKAHDKSWVHLEPLMSLSSSPPFTARVDRVSFAPAAGRGLDPQSSFMVIMLTRDDGKKIGFIEHEPSTNTIRWGEALLTGRSYVFPSIANNSDVINR